MRFRLFSVVAWFVFFMCVLLRTSWAADEKNGVPLPPVVDRSVQADEVFRTGAYRLGTGDVISIRVYGEDDLTKEKLRLPDSGILQFPFGDLKVTGLTLGDVERAIADGLRGRFLLNPRVSVNIDEYRPFFIYGQVERPGGYPFQFGLNVRKAVSLAGGFKERASLNKIFIVREGMLGEQAQKIDLNTPVYPGDTVTVEESFF